MYIFTNNGVAQSNSTMNDNYKQKIAQAVQNTLEIQADPVVSVLSPVNLHESIQWDDYILVTI